MDYKKAFIKNLKKYRRENNLTQDDLADMLGYSQKNIAKWEQGYSIPPIDVMIELSKKMELSLDDILGLNEKTIYTKCCEYIETVCSDLATDNKVDFDFNVSMSGRDIIKDQVFNLFNKIAHNVSKDSEKCKNNLNKSLEGYVKNSKTLQNEALKFLNDNCYLVLKDSFYISTDLVEECFDIAEESYKNRIKSFEQDLEETMQNKNNNSDMVNMAKTVLADEQVELNNLLELKKEYFN